MGIVARVLAPVDALVPDPPCPALAPDRVALHPLAAAGANDEPPQRSGDGWERSGRGPGAAGARSVSLARYGLADDGRHDAVGLDDLSSRSGGHPGDVASRRIVDVVEALHLAVAPVAALALVLGVHDDGPHGGDRPCPSRGDAGCAPGRPQKGRGVLARSSRVAMVRKPIPSTRQAKICSTTFDVCRSMDRLVSWTPCRAFSGLGWGTPVRSNL